MPIKFRETTNDELILLHDFYYESSEPDAPKEKFEKLTEAEQADALSRYCLENYRSVFDAADLIGFVGFFPDDDCNVNIFYVVSPAKRGKGYLSKILELLIVYCREEFSEFQNIRTLTREQNLPSIRGLERASFARRNSIVEDVQPDVIYEEYFFNI